MRCSAAVCIFGAYACACNNNHGCCLRTSCHTVCAHTLYCALALLVWRPQWVHCHQNCGNVVKHAEFADLIGSSNVGGTAAVNELPVGTDDAPAFCMCCTCMAIIMSADGLKSLSAGAPDANAGIAVGYLNHVQRACMSLSTVLLFRRCRACMHAKLCGTCLRQVQASLHATRCMLHSGSNMQWL